MKEDPMLIFLLASIMKDKSMMEESAKLSLESEKYHPFGKYFNELDEILQLRFVSDAVLKELVALELTRPSAATPARLPISRHCASDNPGKRMDLGVWSTIVFPHKSDRTNQIQGYQRGLINIRSGHPDHERHETLAQ
jgi:hypothetical protein